MSLLNVEKAHKEAPTTFQILPRQKREAFQQGDLVKLIWRKKGCGERAWVQVTDVERNGKVRYRGTVDNKGTSCAPAYGSSVSFKPEHIAQAMPPGIIRNIPIWLALGAATGVAIAMSRRN